MPALFAQRPPANAPATPTLPRRGAERLIGGSGLVDETAPVEVPTDLSSLNSQMLSKADTTVATDEEPVAQDQIADLPDTSNLSEWSWRDEIAPDFLVQIPFIPPEPIDLEQKARNAARRSQSRRTGSRRPLGGRTTGPRAS